MKKSIMLFFILATASAYSQDMQKVVQIVKRMETNLKAMVESEKEQREASFLAITHELGLVRNQLDLVSSNQSKTTTSLDSSNSTMRHAGVKNLILRLQQGNDRFVAGKPSAKDFQRDRAELISAQHPYSIVLTCSDSRVPPELIFDESLGQIFVIRTAGNIVDSVVLGSIEYAAEHLHAGLMVVLGHKDCGAVKATISGGKVPPDIGSLVSRIQPAVDRARATHVGEKDLLDACVEENVHRQMEQSLIQSDLLNELVGQGELSIVGAVYNLETGRVEFLSQDGNAAAAATPDKHSSTHSVAKAK